MSWNLSRTINNILFDIIDIQADVTTLEGKTQNINEAIPDETKFAGDIYADKYVINNDTSPPKKLYSNGSLTTQGDLIFLDTEPKNEDVNRTYFDKSLNYYAASDAGFPVPDALPTYYISTVNISNESELANFCTTFSDRVEAIITQSFTISSTITVNTLCNKCKIRGLTQNVTLSCNLSTSMFNIYAEEISFDNITLLNSNTGSNASILNFVYVGGTNYITNCIFRTNEFAITSISWYLQILNNFFTFFGTADSHRYIMLSGLKEVFINNNIFQGNSLTSSTQCVNINNGLASAFLNGNLIMKNNTTDINYFPVQRLLMVDIPLTNSNFSIYASSNIMSCTSGFMIFYALPLDGIKQIYLYNNTELLGGAASGSKGLIGLDSPSNSVISFNTKIYSAKNTVPYLRADYTDLVNPVANQARVIAYATARFTPGANKYDLIIPFVGNANTGSIVPVDISGLETKTQNLNATASLNTLTKNTDIRLFQNEKLRFLNDADDTEKFIVNNTNVLSYVDIYSNKFIVNEGPSPPAFMLSNGNLISGTSQQYLMANGSTLQYSANSGNSNFYLFNSSSTVTASPSSGQITYDDAKQSNATNIYISHITDDNIDIEVFYKQLSILNDVYIQDRNDSQNNIQYNIRANPTITLNNKIEIPVLVTSSSGTGTTSFGPNHPILISFFTNSIEADTRITALENGKLNKDGSTIMTGNLNMGSIYKVIGLVNPSLSSDATNKNYVDTADALKLNLSGGTMLGNVDMNNNKLVNVGTPTQNLDAVNRLYVDNVSSLKLNLSGGTMTGALNMNNNILNGIPTPLNNGDCANKLYVDNRNTALATQLPYVGANGIISGATRNFWIQQGVTTIQSAINSVTVGSVIELSTGSWTENIICSGQNYTICGADCPAYAQTTQVTGTVQIGATSPATTQTRVRIKNIKFIGSLSFGGSTTFQELRTYIDNCDISGTVSFTNLVATIAGGTQIYFTNCSFSGSNNPLTTIQDQALYSIYFTRCTFNSQPITNNLAVGNFSRLIFSDCGTLPSFSLGNCVLNGLNGSAVTTNVSAGSITLGGVASSFLMGNGSLNSTVYSQVSSGTFTMTWTGGGVASSSQTIYYSKIGIPNGAGTVTLRFPAFVVTIGAATTTAITSTAPISVLGLTLNPTLGAPLIAAPIRFNNAQVGLGWIEINTAGNLGIYGPTFGSYWTANTANCGLGNIATITYTV